MFNIMNCLANSEASFELINIGYGDNPILCIYKHGTPLVVEREIKPLAYSSKKEYDVWHTFEAMISDANTALNAKFDEWPHDFEYKYQALKAYREARREAKTLLKIFNGSLKPITEAVWADDELNCSKD